MLGAIRTRVTQTAVKQLLPRSAPLYRPAAVAPLLSSAYRLMSSVTIVVPPIADSISEGTLAEFTVEAGSAVEADQVVAKLDTDKVSVDIRATAGGKVSKMHAKVGDNVKVGAPLMDVEVGAAGTASSASASKPIAPVMVPAGAPSSDESAKKPPVAQSGTQAPASTHPTDPHDTQQRAHHPSIAFRFGKRDAAGSVGGPAGATHQHQGNQTLPVTGQDFISANEAAAAAWDALPARYKARGLKAAELDVIELGGAPNYEKKVKKGAAK